MKQRSCRERALLTLHDAQTVAPTFGQADAQDFHRVYQIAQQYVLGGVEAQSRSNEINERRSFLQLYTREISVTREVALLQVSLNAQPIFGGLQRKIDV